jgi:hypothetical protein
LNHDKIEEEIRHSDTESESLEDDYQNPIKIILGIIIDFKNNKIILTFSK